MARREGTKLLQQLNRRARELHKRDKRRESATNRINIGLYWYQENEEPESDDTT